MNLHRLHTESIRHFQHQAIGNHGHEGLARSQGNPAGELTLGINDVPNLVPPGHQGPAQRLTSARRRLGASGAVRRNRVAVVLG